MSDITFKRTIPFTAKETNLSVHRPQAVKFLISLRIRDVLVYHENPSKMENSGFNNRPPQFTHPQSSHAPYKQLVIEGECRDTVASVVIEELNYDRMVVSFKPSKATYPGAPKIMYAEIKPYSINFTLVRPETKEEVIRSMKKIEETCIQAI